MKDLQKLNKYFVKYKYRFLIGIAITIASQIFTVLTPQYVGVAITTLQNFLQNELTAEATKQSQFNMSLMIVETTLLVGFFNFLMKLCIIVMYTLIEFDIKIDIYKQYQSIGQDFYKRQRTGN